MPYKSRTKPSDLEILELLASRMNLDANIQQHYFNLKKGYEGEQLFDSLTANLHSHYIVLNDLLLEANHTTFQIDTFIIAKQKNYIFEVKNYEDDYIYEQDKLYKKPQMEVLNPLHQLGRSESLLRQLLHSLGFNSPIEASVVFINPNFYLYQAPLDKPFIFPTQVRSHIGKLNAVSSELTSRHYKLAQQLVKLHKPVNSFNQIPEYDYAQLRKGIRCSQCRSFSVFIKK
ncbi:nuclease-related domain-containing protein [Virgibacillus sp. 179-BFC.A HS]|uniref:Nuclease-related domain-containing protein n=1 Tax=Tigheibacillus jepli TaxID=3035914 RepID=A0ABU5CIJ8_9BACI|nr:nuclease-related domain-containing protein [Virgibacillus sp. 179-BFC.A HS]MDY0406177.1 nuclease-related domain-containing protein [Virgibacillus sp. 179-BFC.A HS]